MANALRGTRNKESLTSQSFVRLVSRARDGSRSALGRLMASCRPWLRRRALKKVPGNLAHIEDASDLVQECQAAATRKFEQFRGENIRSFRKWLAVILKRLIYRARRSQGQAKRDWRRNRSLDAAADRGGVSEPFVVPPGFPREPELEEKLDRLMRVLNWCRSEDREVITRHNLEGRSHKEIGDEIGCKESAVRMRHSRAISRVAEAIGLLASLDQRRLGPAQQEAIMLWHLQRLSPARIAEMLQLPEPLVVRWIADAKPTLLDGSEDMT